MGVARYIIKNAKDVVKTIKKPIIDTIITSPPYWNMKDYGSKDQIGFGQSYYDYINELTDILDNCKHVLKDTGSMWIIIDSFKEKGNIRMLPFDLAERLRARGWYFQDTIIWYKDKTLPYSSKGKLRNIFEYILVFTRHQTNFKYNIDSLRDLDITKWWVKYPERYHPKGKAPTRIWELSIPMQGWGTPWVRHFCPFPPQLVENILLITTEKNDYVMDPFAGSGSVLAQSKVMGRNAVGFDLNPEYKKVFEDMVLPYYKELWKKREKELDAIEKQRKELEKTIKQLRLLKYPSELIKQIKRDNSDIHNNLLGIIVLGKIESQEADYCFVYGEKQDKNAVIEKLEKISKKTKLRKLSLTPVFYVLDTSEVRDKIKNHEILYFYDLKSTNQYNEELLSKDINKYFEKKDKIIVISNLKIEQKII